jgi:glycerol kinase
MRSEFWMRNKADVVNRPIEAPEIEGTIPSAEASSPALAFGLYKNEQEIGHVRDRARKPGRE